MKRIQVQLWYNRFKEGPDDVNDDACSGHPSTSRTHENFEAVKKMILDNRQNTIREVANDVSISFGSCQAMFTAPKVVSKLLNFGQKQLRIDIALEMIQIFAKRS